MWMAEPMEGEVVGELPTYAPAFKEALYPGGDGRKCFGGNGLVPEVSGRGDAREIASISRLWVKAEQADADRHPTPQLWPLNHKGCGEHAARAIELDAP